MKRVEPALRDHLEWIGFIQPTGLVVSAPALVHAGAILNSRDIEGQRRLAACTGGGEDSGGEEGATVPDFEHLATSVLEWSLSPKGYAGMEGVPIPAELEVTLPDFGETLRPHYAVRERNPGDGETDWQLLVTVLDPHQELDREYKPTGSTLHASAHSRMERLLRQTGVPAGLLFNGHVLRLISAPYGESSGWMDFRIEQMVQTAGRPILAALRLLLGEDRLLTLPPDKRLAALLAESRRYQNTVSEKLAEQVLHALYELLRGFQAAHNESGNSLLGDVLERDPDRVYHALLTVILRLVFLLYSEERGMLPEDEAFVRHYSLAGLHERLREDAALNPDTMDQRYGAWAQLLVLFRIVYDGGHAGGFNLPRRHGVLFDPDRFPFLEGRGPAGGRQKHEAIPVPLVPDGTIYRALEKLLVLDGERISYRALDVEQIGSVYETMMGFRLEAATGRSIAVKSGKRQGAPTAVNLDALLEVEPAKRRKWVQDRAGRKVSPGVNKALRAAHSLTDLHAALRPVTDRAATPDLVPRGAMVLQPSEERRTSGSHYTPRELTEPIVRKTLEPILVRLREQAGGVPTPEEILELKVCDPAMGSGAFLVETCRQLGDELLHAWEAHGGMPPVPSDEDEVVFARRTVAQRCLYGVDRNPVAVDLAKVSLWLATLARDHAFTFLDHALRHGDSLVGLTRRQIEAFHWKPTAARFEPGFEAMRIADHMETASALRGRIREAGEEIQDGELRDLWNRADHELDHVRLFGDLVVAAFFSESRAKERETERAKLANAVVSGEAPNHRGWLDELRAGDPPLAPLHWEVEFPEVFERERPGFDAFVGNPPFAGKNTTINANPAGYLDWLKTIHAQSHGNADLVAHFFRQCFGLLRPNGTLGLIATNTIAQGDTRSTGLRWICTHDGEIYEARTRLKWPGMAAVVVSVVHIAKGTYSGGRRLDGREVDTITAFLFHRGGHEDPEKLAANEGLSFQGSIVLGMGFTFDDTDSKGVATPIAEMERLVREEPRNQQVIFPYIGGAEVNESPTHSHHRYVINFGERSEEECRREWPELMAIVEERVRPARMRDKRATYKKYWWQFAEKRVELAVAQRGVRRAWVTCRHQPNWGVAALPSRAVFAESLVVFPLETYAAFAALQARPHELWARFFGSTLEDRLRYTPSDCFETCPLPVDWQAHPRLEAAGEEYYEFRAHLVVRNDEGLTKTYNRFHDPEDEDAGIIRLRELHAEMDRAVLAAYGWLDIPTECDFFLDYEIDEETWNPRKKKPIRYRWPDDVHDEVLARLLELNAERAAEEARLGGAVAATPTRPHAQGSQVTTDNWDLFE